MKKLRLLVATTFFLSMSAMAQPKIYFNGNIGYTFDESFNGFYAQWRYQGNTHYGGSLEFVLAGVSTEHNESTLELTYQGMKSDLNAWTFFNNLIRAITGEMSVSYITLGGNNYFGKNHKMMGFGGLALGAAIFDGKAAVGNTLETAAATKFAINFKGGGRFMFSDNIGLKLYAQLNTVVGGVGGGFVFGSGGSGAAVGTSSSMLQFGLGGGLTIGFGGKPTNTNSNKQR